jgi:hypothetical protein
MLVIFNAFAKCLTHWSSGVRRTDSVVPPVSSLKASTLDAYFSAS